MIIFSRSNLARKTESKLKLHGETPKVYLQVKFLGITFDSQLTFRQHFEDILDHWNTRYHRLRLPANKKWGPCPSTSIQIYKQCVRPISGHGSLSTVTTSANIISKIQWLQNKFISLALCLPKYICSKQLDDSTGLPYVKDTCNQVPRQNRTKPSSRGVVDIFQQAYSCLEQFPKAIISSPSKRQSLSETGSPASDVGTFYTVLGPRIYSQHRLPRQADSKEASCICQ